MMESVPGSLQSIEIPFVGGQGDMVSFIEGEEDHHYQILDRSWHGGFPGITLLPLERSGDMLGCGGPPFKIDLRNLSEISFRFSGPLLCVGRFPDDGYVPCPNLNPPAEGYSQCMECLVQDIPDPACLFEPHCHEAPCGASSCQVPHVVYFTSFRNSLKVGMTQFRRMRERAMEQGADAMLPLFLLKDRFSARSYEAAVSKTLAIPQMVRGNVKLRNTASARDLDGIGEGLMQVKEDLKMMWEDVEAISHPKAIVLEDPGQFGMEPIKLNDYPLLEPLPSIPKRFKGERVKGSVLGFKGSYMFFRQGGIWAYRLAEVPGRILHTSDDIRSIHQ
jgi:hypothetical protein